MKNWKFPVQSLQVGARTPRQHGDGAHRLAYQAIYIRGGVCRQEAQDTLFHELLHAVDSHLRLELTEGQIYGLATGLLDILWGNPKLAKWIIRSAE